MEQYHNGLNRHRLEKDPLERTFAEIWQDINDRHEILDAILSNRFSFLDGEPDGRDRDVAASVIQWLGSPAGQDFLRAVEEKEGEMGGK